MIHQSEREKTGSGFELIAMLEEFFFLSRLWISKGICGV